MLIIQHFLPEPPVTNPTSVAGLALSVLSDGSRGLVV